MQQYLWHLGLTKDLLYLSLGLSYVWGILLLHYIPGLISRVILTLHLRQRTAELPTYITRFFPINLFVFVLNIGHAHTILFLCLLFLYKYDIPLSPYDLRELGMVYVVFIALYTMGLYLRSFSWRLWCYLFPKGISNEESDLTQYDMQGISLLIYILKLVFLPCLMVIESLTYSLFFVIVLFVLIITLRSILFIHRNKTNKSTLSLVFLYLCIGEFTPYVYISLATLIWSHVTGLHY